MSSSNNKKQLLAIVGPTAVGKSSLSVKIGRKKDGEVISADSRQVYRRLNIATGKITQEQMQGVPHHLLNVADPDEEFSVYNYKELADKRIQKTHERNKLPILCGGSGFYIQAVIDDLVFPDVPPNETLREKLRERSTADLFAELQKKDPRRAEEIDENNPRRLIRALEIVEALGKVPKLEKRERFDTLQIGLQLPDKKLKQNIIKRTKERFDQGMVSEAKKLHSDGLSLDRMRELGLEYKHLADYLEKKIDKESLFERIVQGDWQYAKRQRTWFQKDERIRWFNPDETNKIMDVVNDFTNKKTPTAKSVGV